MRERKLNPGLMAIRNLVLALGGRAVSERAFGPDEAWGLMDLLVDRARRSANLSEQARAIMREFAGLARIPVGAEVEAIAAGIERVLGPAPDPERLREAVRYIRLQINGTFLEGAKPARDRTLLGLDLPPARPPPKPGSS